MFCTPRSRRCLSVAALLDSSRRTVSRLFCMEHFSRDVLPWWSTALIMSGVKSFRFKINFGWTVGQYWNNRWGIVCFVSLIVSELKWMVFLEFLFVRYSSTMLLCPFIIANISGERPEVVDKARSLRPWKKWDQMNSDVWCRWILHLNHHRTIWTARCSLSSRLYVAGCSQTHLASLRVHPIGLCRSLAGRWSSGTPWTQWGTLAGTCPWGYRQDDISHS